MCFSILQVPRCRIPTLATFWRESFHSLSRTDNRKWTRSPIFTKSDTFSVNKTEISQFQKSQYIDIQQKIAENKDLSSLVTIIVFDFETTGFSRLNDGIIEIALRDLEGGENSTFQTLVNPKRYIPNSHIHGITTRMVNRPEVPRYSIF